MKVRQLVIAGVIAAALAGVAASASAFAIECSVWYWPFC